MPENVARRIDAAAVDLGMEVEIVSTPNTFRLIEQGALSRTENNQDRYPVTAALRANVRALETIAFGAPLGDDVDRTNGAWLARVRHALGDGQRPFCDRLRDVLHAGLVLGRGYVVALRSSETKRGRQIYVQLREDPAPLNPRPSYTDPEWIRVDDSEVRLLGGEAPRPRLDIEAQSDGSWVGTISLAEGVREVSVASIDELPAMLRALIGGAYEPAEGAVGEDSASAADAAKHDPAEDAVPAAPTDEGQEADSVVVGDDTRERLPANDNLRAIAADNGRIHVYGGRALERVGDATVAVEMPDAPDGTYEITGDELVREADLSAVYPELVEPPLSLESGVRLMVSLTDLDLVASVAEPEAGEAFANVLFRPIGAGECEIVACGRARVARRVAELQGTIPGDIKIPASDLKVLARMQGDAWIDVAMQESKVTVSSGAVSVTTLVHDSAFPPYSKHMPKRTAFVALLNREAALSALEALEDQVDAKTRAVEVVATQTGFEFVPWASGERGTAVQVPGRRLYDETVPDGDVVLFAPLDISCYKPGNDSIGGFKLDYLRDAIRSSVADHVCLASNARNHPFVLYPQIIV